MRIRTLATGARLMMTGRANIGRCVICQQSTLFIERGTWLRDDYVCLRCNSRPRERALIQTMETQFPDWRQRVIHECSPDGPVSRKLRTEGVFYSSGSYPGEDIERLPYEDASFDLLVTQEVMEHVLQPDLAVREIARVLKPGGAHIFTTPVFRGRRTMVRAVHSDSGVEHLQPPDYHGTYLVATEWGDDFPDFVTTHSGLSTESFSYHDRHLGLDGEFLEVFVTSR